MGWSKKLTFSMVMFPFQFLMLGLFAGFASYRDIGKSHNNTTNYITDHYPLFQDVHVMICFGVGFLLCYLKMHGYASLTYNFMLVSIVAQWSTFVNPWITHGLDKKYTAGLNIKIGIEELIAGDFSSAVILITWCVLIGKTSRLQLFVIALVEPIFYAISKVIVYNLLHVSDIGGSVTIHFFAAYYGLALSYVIGSHAGAHDKEVTTYQSDLFCMVGTLFLWVYWPSFNGCELGGLQGQQMRAIVNTYFSLLACVVATVGLAPLLNKQSKIEMVYIQNATLAGGVSAGTVANMMIQPWGAVCVGMLAGVISTLGYAYLSNILHQYLKIHDSAGVHNLHALPGILSVLASVIATATIKPECYPSLDEYHSIYPMVKTSKYSVGNRTMATQALYQLSSIPVVFVIAVAGGLLNGVLIKGLDHPDEDQLFDESREFKIPEETNEEMDFHSHDKKTSPSKLRTYSQTVDEREDRKQDTVL